MQVHLVTMELHPPFLTGQQMTLPPLYYPRAQASRVMQSGWCPCIYMSSKKIVIERTRDLIYLKFVATDFSPKIISPSAGENSGDSA